jgi:AAA ATPase domain
MKLKSLHIDAYRHLENIVFDFTYPEGHAKAGKPLEKICIIGQSATGKTSILELIKQSFLILNSVEVIDERHLRIVAGMDAPKLNFSGHLEYLYKGDVLAVAKDIIIRNEKTLIYTIGSGPIEKLIKDGLRLIYLSAEIISNETINLFNQNPLNILIETEKEKYAGLNSKSKQTNFIYEFTEHTNIETWFSIFYKILDYRKKFTQMASELISKGAIGDISKLNKEYNKWSKTNENPLESFTKYFNPVIERLRVEIDLVNTEYTVPIKSKINEEIIPTKNLSTGTKGLLLSLFPLYELDTTDAIILLDEPERSLFPDMQIDLITHYQRIAPDAQFVVATHSPFIAAAFEPEERFILFFDDNGKVAVRRGESPIGDDPNDILSNDFKVDYYNDFGKKAYQEYLEIKRKISRETETEKKNKLIIEAARIGDKYNF